MTIREIPEEEYKKKYHTLDDDRHKVKKGDLIIGNWWANGIYMFVVDELDKQEEDDLGLGMVYEDGHYDIGQAYHVILVTI